VCVVQSIVRQGKGADIADACHNREEWQARLHRMGGSLVSHWNSSSFPSIKASSSGTRGAQCQYFCHGTYPVFPRDETDAFRSRATIGSNLRRRKVGELKVPRATTEGMIQA
jgi:hypothetical protein